MAAREDLIAVWTTGRPAGVTGTTFVSGDTVAVKLAAIATWRVVSGSPEKVLLSPSVILNAIVPADLAGLTQLQTLQLSLLLSGSAVDASAGSTIRAGMATLFSGKATTLSNLGALVVLGSTPTIDWWRSVGFQEQVGTADVTLAGLS